jgi:hypothetical protein
MSAASKPDRRVKRQEAAKASNGTHAPTTNDRAAKALERFVKHLARKTAREIVNRAPDGLTLPPRPAKE